MNILKTTSTANLKHNVEYYAPFIVSQNGKINYTTASNMEVHGGRGDN